MNDSKSFFSRPLVAGITGGLVVGLLGWLAIAAGLIETDRSPAQAPIASVVQPSTPVATEDGKSIGEVYEQSGPAIAFIEAEQAGATSSPFGPAPGNGGTATGSGFLVDDEGRILTNAHVVEGSDSISVRLGQDGEELEAELLGSDTSTDVAVLKVDPGEVTAAPLALGDSGGAVVGDGVIAIGNPLGLDLTVTSGIVSALQREISAPDGFTISDVIQTDAAINPGNSGGPLLDATGKVIGINSQIATAGGQGSVGIGFAVPINKAKTVFEQILDDGEADHAFVGVAGAELTPELADALGLELDRGVLIQNVTPDSPAEEAGLRAGETTVSDGGQEIRVGGDVILAVDGEPVSEMEQVAAAVSAKLPGDEITLEISRDGESQELTLTLADRPTSAGS